MIRYLRRAVPGLIVLLTMLLHTTGHIDLPLVQRLENFAYDIRLRATAPGGIDERVVIVDIDENSLRREGRWPWDRDKLARLVSHLFDEYRAAVVGFDMVFAERDQNAALAALRTTLSRQPDAATQTLLSTLQPLLDHDQDFSHHLKGRPVVLGYYFTNDSLTTQHSGLLPTATLHVGDFSSNMTDAVTARGYVANLPKLQRNAAGAGFFDNPRVDLDGVFRRVPLLQQHEGSLYEALSLAVARIYLRTSLLPVLAADTHPGYPALEALRLGALRIPVDGEAAALVPYRGPKDSFRYLSASAVLHKTVAVPGLLNGAIVLIGSSAPGLLDLRSTPVQHIYPGVEIHANLISGILDQRIKQQPSYTRASEFLLLLVLGLLLAFLLPKLNALTATAVSICALILVAAENFYFWQVQNLVLPLAPSMLMVVAMFVANMAHGFFIEGRTKRQLGQLFGQYVPPELVENMSKDPARYTLEGEKRDMTVLFSDVRGFTTLSEGLDPKELSSLINAILTPMTHIIHDHHGTIDKYMGDAIMAFWGAPVADRAHAEHAVSAALAMARALAELRTAFHARGWPELDMGIGLSSGPMNVGNMGSEFRMAYTVLGDTVNLGSRLESQTKVYGTPIIVSDATRLAAPGIVYLELDRVRVKGKQNAVAIFAPIGKEDLGTVARNELALLAEALALYRAQQWSRAEALYTDLVGHSVRVDYCRLFLWRIDYFRKNPPGDDWDGVFISRRQAG
jgi:adenylate cyclase